MILVVAASSEPRARALVVVIGTLRGGPVAWRSLRDHVVDSLSGPRGDVKVALLVGGARDDQLARFRAQFAAGQVAHVWPVAERDDWGDALEALSARHGVSYRAWLARMAPGLRRAHQFLGGVAAAGHRGSAGILLALRWELADRLAELARSGERFEWLVVTRADFLYLCDHPDPGGWRRDAIHVPSAEGNGGVTDRHTLLPWDLARRALNVTFELIADPTFLGREFWDPDSLPKRPPKVNLEIVLRRYYEHAGLAVHKYEHTGFTVATRNDATRWRHPKFDVPELARLDLGVKYQFEFQQVKRNCGPRALGDACRAALRRGLPAADVRGGSQNATACGDASEVVGCAPTRCQKGHFQRRCCEQAFPALPGI